MLKKPENIFTRLVAKRIGEGLYSPSFFIFALANRKMQMEQHNKIIVFQETGIRRVWYKDKWWFNSCLRKVMHNYCHFFEKFSKK